MTSAHECPHCGGYVDIDETERTAECVQCGWSDSYDWSADVEARDEARVLDRESLGDLRDY